MLDVVILGSSILLQLMAAALAVRLAFTTRVPVAWALIALAMMLMAFRRSITFIHMVSDGMGQHVDISAELVALTISLLMLVGVAMIRPLFLSLQRSRDEIKKSEENLRAIAENSGDGILVAVQGRHVFANQKAADILGYSIPELLNTTINDLVHPDDCAKIHDLLPQRVEGSEDVSSHYETLMFRKDGSVVPVELSAATMTWNGQNASMVTMRDITERHIANAQMNKLSSAVEQTADSIIITDRAGVIEYVNPAFETTTGYKRKEVLGNNPNIVKSNRHDESFYKNLWDTILRGEVYRDVLINRRKDGLMYYEEKTITPLKDANGNVTHFVSTGKDITQRMQTEERLHQLAYYDDLTSLPNRALFIDRLSHAMTKRHKSDLQLAVLFLDLDRFKTINDTLGHDIGDRLLQLLSSRLAGCLREGDTVARFGGDEFAIFLEEVPSVDDITHLARKIIDSMAQPYFVGKHELFITTSIGISLSPNDGNDAGTLLKHADVAMYRAKDSGRDTYMFYSEDMSSKAFERLSLETSLRRALERDEFMLYYQPQVSMTDSSIIGVEALLRWDHPELGMVSPLEFIPLLEVTGLIFPVGEWVLSTACQQIIDWDNKGIKPVRMAVNFSGRQFQEPNLALTASNLLSKFGVDPERVEFEITENVLMQNDKLSLDNLNSLHEMGVRLAIDDFGTGYSSLSYLKRFPVKTLKIDKEFIRDIVSDHDDAKIVSAIIAMASSLGLEIIAEGVETHEQARFLQEYYCNYAQGYLYSWPLPAKEITKKLFQNRLVAVQ